MNGDVTAFAWDWAVPVVPELLSDGDARYLVGHDTLGWEMSDSWTYALPDALGSVRQSVDAAGAVVAAREPVLSVAEGWTPYGVEVGDAQAGLGYTGEWFDANVGLQYLRARWYDVARGRFTSRDPWEGETRKPLTANPYLYALANPIIQVDPTGLCAISGSSDCEKFVSEIRYAIEEIKEAQKCSTLVKAIGEVDLVLDFLAWHYSGIPFTWKGLYMGWLPQQSDFEPGDPDRWTVPEWDQQNVPSFSWDHPVNRVNSPLGQSMRHNYGFRRPYFEQTHHYFAFLKFVKHIGGPVVEWMHKKREITDQLQPALDHIPELEQRHEPQSNIREWYAWTYRESVYDLYIVNEAVKLAREVVVLGVDRIPNYIEDKWCAESEADVWSLESEVEKFYFAFPKKYWPDEQYWPGRQ